MARYNRPWDYKVVIFVVVCLVIGWFIKMGIENQTTNFMDGESGISVNYPVTWLPLPEKEAILSMVDPQSQSTFNANFSITAIDWYKELGMDDFIQQYKVWNERSYSLYRIISMNPYEIGALKAIKLEYAYAIEPAEMDIPKIVRAFDIIIAKDDKIYIFTFAADEKDFDNSLTTFNKIRESIEIK